MTMPPAERWLCEVHLADVIAAGALRAELVQLDALHFESRYLFASRQAYEQYIADHSVRLREMTIAKFSSTVRFRRETGVVLCSMP